MVSYEPLWETMRQKNVSTYALIKVHGVNPRIINNLKNGKGITVHTLEKLCNILNCTPNDIIVFRDGE